MKTKMGKKTKTIICTVTGLTLALAGAGAGGYLYHQNQVNKAKEQCQSLTTEVKTQQGELAKLQAQLDKLDTTQKDMGTNTTKPKLKTVATLNKCGYGNTEEAKNIQYINTKTLDTAKADVEKFNTTLLTAYKDKLVKAINNELLSKDEKANYSKEISNLTDPTKAKTLLEKINKKIADNKKAKEKTETETNNTNNTTANTGTTHYTTNRGNTTYRTNRSNTTNRGNTTTRSNTTSRGKTSYHKPAPKPNKPSKPGNTSNGEIEWEEVATMDTNGNRTCAPGLYKWSNGGCYNGPEPKR